MRALVTGGAGFIGCNLADRLASDGAEVVVLDALLRPGVETNLAWLQERHGRKITPIQADVRDGAAVSAAADGADVIFHFAAQVAVTTSLCDPLGDFETNLRGTLNVLEAARPRRTPVIFASTNKVYGDLADIALTVAGGAWRPREDALFRSGIGEQRPLDFHTPYGCSKGGADQYVLDYARSFGVPSCVMRMSCIYGPRQLGTEDQGWVAHFALKGLAGEPITIFGDGRQVRDVLHVADAVEAYVTASRRPEALTGRAFNLGGGPDNAVSLLEVLACLEDILQRKVEAVFDAPRTGDQRYYVSDTTAIRRTLDLPSAQPWRRGVAELVAWLRANRTGARIAEAVS